VPLARTGSDISPQATQYFDVIMSLNIANAIANSNRGDQIGVLHRTLF
jgi:hypothetical protein